MDENFSKILDIAYNLHKSGKFFEAKEVYEKLLSFDENNLDLLNLYAQLNVSIKNYDVALDIFQKIYDATKLDEVKTNIARVLIYKSDYASAIEVLESFENKGVDVLSLLASSYLKIGSYNEAVDFYLKLNKINPSFTNLYNLSIAYGYLEENVDALYYAMQAYQLNKNDFSILLQCANYSEKLEKYDDAIFFLEQAIQINQISGVYIKLGELYKINGKPEVALEHYKLALKLEPQNKYIMFNIAELYRNIDKNVSLNLYMEVLKNHPEDPQVLFNIFTLYSDMMMYEESIIYAKKLIELQPNEGLNYFMLADSYVELYDFENACINYKKASELLKDSANLLSAYAYALQANGQSDEAEKLLLNDLKAPGALRDYTLIHLFKRDFNSLTAEHYYDWHVGIPDEEEGDQKARKFFYKFNVGAKYNINESVFADLKQKHSADFFEQCKVFNKYPWKHEDISNSTLLLFTLHGAGDLIMFSRYIPLVKPLCKKLILQVPIAFQTLFKYNFPDIEIYTDKDIIPKEKYDYTGTVMNLIYNLNCGFTNIPFSEGYLKVSDELVNKFSKLKELQTKKKKIGIFWQGNPTLMRNRSVLLEKLLPLFSLENAQIYSFQLSNIDAESHKLKSTLPIIDLAPLIKNYEDTSALLKNMDLLISIDTSILNLAGALGVKTFLMLPKTAEWRWFDSTKTTPWYDSVRIFKQEKDLCWEPVIDSIVSELKNEH